MIRVGGALAPATEATAAAVVGRPAPAQGHEAEIEAAPTSAGGLALETAKTAAIREAGIVPGGLLASEGAILHYLQ